MRKSHPLSRPSLLRLEDLTRPSHFFFQSKINTIVLYIHLQIPLTIMKPHEKVEVPIGVIVGSVMAGILLLLALVAILWKVRTVSYFKIWGLFHILKCKDLCLPIFLSQSCPKFYVVRKKEMQVLFAYSHSNFWKQSVTILSPVVLIPLPQPSFVLTLNVLFSCK